MCLYSTICSRYLRFLSLLSVVHCRQDSRTAKAHLEPEILFQDFLQLVMGPLGSEDCCDSDPRCTAIVGASMCLDPFTDAERDSGRVPAAASDLWHANRFQANYFPMHHDCMVPVWIFQISLTNSCRLDPCSFLVRLQGSNAATVKVRGRGHPRLPVGSQQPLGD